LSFWYAYQATPVEKAEGEKRGEGEWRQEGGRGKEEERRAGGGREEGRRRLLRNRKAVKGRGGGQ
jgi:hypothetical protein